MPPAACEDEGPRTSAQLGPRGCVNATRRTLHVLARTAHATHPNTPPRAAKEEDIVDEALRLFRANMLFRNFEVLGGGDRVLVYLTLFIHQVRA
jgi:hypothetical protein